MALVKYAIFHPWRTSAIVLVGIILGLGSFYVYQVNNALDAVATEDFDPAGARLAIPAVPGAVGDGLRPRLTPANG